MAIEPVDMGTAVTAAAVLPLFFKMVLKQPAWFTFFASVSLALVVKEIVFWMVYPGFQNDALWGVSMIMYFMICSAISGAVILLLRLVRGAELRHKFREMK